MREFELYIDSAVSKKSCYSVDQWNYERAKRILDIFLSITFLLISWLPMLIIALGIKLNSPGPVFYQQKRIGKDGRPFRMFKFRSMRLGSDSESNSDIHRQYTLRLIREDVHPQDLGFYSLKIKSDPRVTGLGQILRRACLDELPQFLNVLRGDMSVVGPRPPLPYEYELYSDREKTRLKVLPGMTGLWQVTAHNTVSFSEMVQIDLEYIEKMSLWLDLKIIFRTPLEMVWGKGGG